MSTDTPRTDAQVRKENPIGEPGNTAVITTEFARQLERELRDVLSDTTYYIRKERLEQLERELAAEKEQVSILRSDLKRLEGFAKTYRLRVDEAEDKLAAERAELAKVRDQLADYIQADLDDSVMRSAATWRPLPGDPEQFYPQNQTETDDDQQP